ncbi:TPA: hypothetical protein HA244_04175 [Candidatus Micrarchaeota archaeon]|nr:hypothetical protein [Candidatus Micrarchaeota archaeon]
MPARTLSKARLLFSGLKAEQRRQLPLALVEGTHEELFRKAGRTLPRHVTLTAMEIERLKRSFASSMQLMHSQQRPAGERETLTAGFVRAIAAVSGHKRPEDIRNALNRTIQQPKTRAA